MFDVMAEIEALCGRYAARRMSPADAQANEAGLLACEAAAAQGEVEDYYRANHAFHAALYAASGNRFLAGEAERLHRRLQLRVRVRMQESLAEHRRIFKALTAGDEGATSAELRSHIAVQGDRFADLAAGYRVAMGRAKPARGG